MTDPGRGRELSGPATAVARQVAAQLTGQVASPEADARQLVAALVDRTPAELILADVTADQGRDLAVWVERRRRGEPLQHILRRAWFRTIEVAVGPGVFVPRPETETMVQAALDELASLTADPPRVVDLCTGSGVIAKAIAAEHPTAEVHAVELSHEALDWAQSNLAGTGVALHEGDITDALADQDAAFDVVITNPPYVPLEAWESVPAEVRDHDPALALFSGDDGLDLMRVITRVGLRLLRPGGLLLTEHAELQHDQIVALFAGAGWAEVRDHQDLTGRWRFITARRPVGSVA